jgi:hypothetical protein
MKIKTMSASTVGLRQLLVIISILVLSLNGKGTSNETTTLRISSSTEALDDGARLTLTTKGELFDIFLIGNLHKKHSLINSIISFEKLGVTNFKKKLNSGIN